MVSSRTRDRLDRSMSKNTFVEPLPLSNVESGLAGERAQFLLNTWKDNSGVMIRDSRMTKLSPWLLLTLPSAEPGDVPKITFAGNQTTFRRFFPHALDPEAPKPATSQICAITGIPVCEARSVNRRL